MKELTCGTCGKTDTMQEIALNLFSGTTHVSATEESVWQEVDGVATCGDCMEEKYGGCLD